MARPPNEKRPPGGPNRGVNESSWETSRRGHRSPVLAFLEGRERILGQHRPIHITDASTAADELALALGGVARARRFVLDILDELKLLREVS